MIIVTSSSDSVVGLIVDGFSGVVTDFMVEVSGSVVELRT